MRKRTKNIMLYIFIAVIAIVAFSYYQNNALSVTKFRISSDKLPDGFDSYRIVHLTDIHSKSFGKNQSNLVRKVKKLKPDLIAVTGDLVDRRKYNAEASIILMREMTKLAPVYYVTGNHECCWSKFEPLGKRLNELGVHVMRNKSEFIKLGYGEIRIAGVDDPTFNQHADGNAAKLNQHIGAALQGTGTSDAFTILLSHRPELFSVYVQNKMDLTFSGHAHGGQVRLPFVGGLIAPGQGFLPKYDAGKYADGDSTLIVSRGLGNSIIPQRLFNRPEIVMVELTPQSSPNE
ncbi:MAG: metallophosphoesterase [Bacillota bacterium]